jgi:DNA-directed RNA polymerase specialized sigma24 family protein
MLEELSKKNKKWLSMAYNLCKDYDYARDIVQDMYLKIYDINQKYPEKEIKDVYVWAVLCNIIKENQRVNNGFKIVSLDCILDVAIKENVFELDDESLLLLNRADNLRALYRECLIHNYDKSIREIEQFSGVNYGYWHRVLKKGRKEILGDRYDKEYKNKRNKRL